MCEEKIDLIMKSFKRNKIQDISGTRNYNWDDAVLKECFSILLENQKKPSNGWFKRLSEFGNITVGLNFFASSISMEA